MKGRFEFPCLRGKFDMILTRYMVWEPVDYIFMVILVVSLVRWPVLREVPGRLTSSIKLLM